jgi:(1->4)-alpha-D-glucan 1-alpha-D-glucosylmutase
MPGLLYELNFIENVFLLDSEGLSQEEKSEFIDFVMKFQQFSSPLMAKGFEDTILYVYNRFLSLNEVGGSPNKFGISLEKFHRFSKQRGSLWPYSLNTTSTHDTKRGEDIRARINVLSEIPKEWEKNIKIWAKINKRKKKALNGAKAPDRNDEYFLYQTLVGAFPFNESEYPSFVERLKNYMVKAVREAKVHTAWLKPDINYEKASISFIEKILSPLQDNHFLKEFIPFQKQVAHYGIFNSLSQTLVKMTAPGVPDFYQGTELWDLNLVDPDNRRLVDFKKRELFLENIIESLGGNVLDLISELLSTKEDGRIKLFFIHSVLKVRKEKVEIFEKGHYLPLKVGGTFKEHVLAFARSYKGIWAISIVPRFLTTLIKKDEFPLGEQVWADTHVILPKESPFFWKEVITAEQIKAEGAIRIGTALKYFPVALLMSEVKNEEKR